MAAQDPRSSYSGAAAGSVPYPSSSSAAAAPAAAPAAPAAAPPLSAGYPRSGDFIVVWQVWDEGCWIDYDKAFCETLERAAEARTKEFDMRPRGNVTFRYDLQGMWQENLDTNTRRPFRRVLWWTTEVDKFPKRKEVVDQHNKEHSNPRAGRRPSASPTRARSRSKSGTRGGNGGAPYGGSASSARGSAE